ncbi:MAG: pitrilysin family protein [Oscillospiraceae bacterium]
MNKKILKSTLLDEKCIVCTHESGLKIFIIEKPEFSSSHAVFGTRYGSIDTKFAKSGENMTEVPNGIAHFLEHKLFESEDGDAFSKYARTGASANAYTSFDRTCYLFGCSDKFMENLDILLNFVSSPFFTPETVEKEQGIIGQEIRMYDDSPGWRVMFNALGAMYHNHPVKIDIAGTINSIAEIDDKLLYECYNTFYNPANMFLCIAGNVSGDKILQKVEKFFENAKSVTVSRGEISEPENIATGYVEQKMAVSMPLFCIGIKDKVAAERTVKEIAVNEILAAMISGKASAFYNSLLENNLLSGDLDAEYFYGRGYSALMFEGESRNPKEVLSALKNHICELSENGIEKEAFLGAKRKVYGRAVRMFNNVEDMVSVLVDSAMNECEPFEFSEELNLVTEYDIKQRIDRIDINNICISVVL